MKFVLCIVKFVEVGVRVKRITVLQAHFGIMGFAYSVMM